MVHHGLYRRSGTHIVTVQDLVVCHNGRHVKPRLLYMYISVLLPCRPFSVHFSQHGDVVRN